MRFRVLSTLAFVLVLRAAASQDRPGAQSASIVPARPYVGDLVECVVPFDPGNTVLKEGSLSVPTPAGNQDVELVGAELSKKSGVWRYTARFIAWKPGLVLVPGAPSAGFDPPEIKVLIASAVDDFGRSPPRYKDPLELPGTRLMVWGIGGAALGAVLFAWSVVFGLLPWMRRLRRAWLAGRAGREFSGTLDYLEKASRSLKEEEVWAFLSRALRRYLGARTNIPYPALTAREAACVFPENLHGEIAEEAAEILAEGDSARFARSPAAGSAAEAVVRARGILTRVEETVRDVLR